jgi:hypothetical protein
MKFFILTLCAIACCACGGLDLEAARQIDALQDLIQQADEQLDNPTDPSAWEEIESEYQAEATAIRADYSDYEAPIQHRLDSLMTYFEVQRKTYQELQSTQAASGQAADSAKTEGGDKSTQAKEDTMNQAGSDSMPAN